MTNKSYRSFAVLITAIAALITAALPALAESAHLKYIGSQENQGKLYATYLVEGTGDGLAIEFRFASGEAYQKLDAKTGTTIMVPADTEIVALVDVAGVTLDEKQPPVDISTPPTIPTYWATTTTTPTATPTRTAQDDAIQMFLPVVMR